MEQTTVQKQRFKIREVAPKLGLDHQDINWKEVSLYRYLWNRGYKIVSKDYIDGEYSDIKTYLDVEIEEIKE
jgi:hypothetical protein